MFLFRSNHQNAYYHLIGIDATMCVYIHCFTLSRIFAQQAICDLLILIVGSVHIQEWEYLIKVSNSLNATRLCYLDYNVETLSPICFSVNPVPPKVANS